MVGSSQPTLRFLGVSLRAPGLRDVVAAVLVSLVVAVVWSVCAGEYSWSAFPAAFAGSITAAAGINFRRHPLQTIAVLVLLFAAAGALSALVAYVIG